MIRREATRDDLLRLGPAVERHERFPQRTNVQLVRVAGANDLDVLVWERGAGETQASGSRVGGKEPARTISPRWNQVGAYWTVVSLRR